MQKRQEKKFSTAIWLPIVWYFIAASRTISRWFSTQSVGAEELDSLSGNPLDRSFFAVLTILGIIVLIKRGSYVTETLKNNKWIILLFIYMGISITWSEFGMVSLKRWIKTSGDLVMALIIITEIYPFAAISTVLKRVIFMQIPLSLFFIVFFPSLGTGSDYLGESMWIGICTHKNELGEVTMISSFFLFGVVMNNWKKKVRPIYGMYLLLSLILLIGSKSTTSLFILIIGIVFYIAFNRKKVSLLKMKKITGFLLLMIIGFVLIFPFRPEIFTQKMLGGIIGVSGKDTTLTGRTDLWYDMLKIASNNPIAGVGYGSFWIGSTTDAIYHIWDTNTWRPQQGHNGYVDVYIELGIIGVIILIGVIASAYKDIMNSLKYDFAHNVFRICLLMMIVIHNITESSYLRGGHNLWFIFVLAILAVPKRRMEANYVMLQQGVTKQL